MRLRLAAVALIGLTVAGCETREQSGTAIGAVAGGLIGSQFGGGPGERLAAGLAGAAIGGLIGNAVGRDLDEQDRRRAFEAERVALYEGRRSEWRSEKAYGWVEAGPTYSRSGGLCREYTHTIYIGGRPRTAVGTACRNPDGSWTPVS
jgi:surface antigen